MSENISAFDLLADDYNGYGLKKVQERLIEMQSGLKTKMDAGLSPDEFKLSQALLNSVETAKETIVLLHSKMQEGG
ncbi:MAG: hypothetical protein IJU40_03785 [Desulfovibrionaceae bacterium]|nr:hypothetical protein [Desulfovibrionaceae bacterium]